jgi:hypothetical protein
MSVRTESGRRGRKRRTGVLALVLAAGTTLLVTACGDADTPAADAGEVDAPAAEAAGTAPEGPAEFDAGAWCDLATASVIALRYDDPGVLADDIATLERMTQLTSGEMREAHQAGLEIRRAVLAVVQDLVEPGMDSQERRSVVDGHPRVLEITQTPDAQLSESRLMGYHLRHCF